MILGAVEGVTEYLPVSSTGHLILTEHVMGISAEEGSTSPESTSPAPGGISRDAIDAYCIVIQLGAILAVLILYWKDIVAVIAGLFGRDRNGLRLGINLIVAFIPAAVAGLLLGDWIESRLFGPVPVAIALAAGAPLMLGVESWRKRRMAALAAGEKLPERELHELGLRQALSIGILQCAALWPGTSRSMMTITGGYLAGLSPAQSARFSFLLGLITLGAASVYTMLRHGSQIATEIAPGPALLGIAIAAATAAISVKWLVGHLTRRGLSLFAYYRLALAAVILLTIIM